MNTPSDFFIPPLSAPARRTFLELMRVEKLGKLAPIYGYREDEAQRALEVALAGGEEVP